MADYELALCFETAFSVGVGNASLYHTATARVIPGATLRGALAATWWRRPDADQAFVELFDDDLLVTAAYPPDAMLRTAATFVCKYMTKPECGQVVVDEAVWEAAECGTAPHECWVCDGPLRLESGWVSLPEAKRRGRVQLDTQETAQDGALFSREYIPVGNGAYVATIQTTKPVDWLEGATVRVGHGRSQDLGRATIRVTEMHEGQEDWPETDRPLALHLTSPAVITDEWGASSVDYRDLEAELRRVSLEEVKLRERQRWLRSELITGWHGQSALPKQPEWGLAAGSTFVVEGLSRAGWSRLRRGIGWRRAEGYGQVALSPLEPKAHPPERISFEDWRRLSAPLRKQQAIWDQLRRLLVETIGSFAKSDEVDETAVANAVERMKPMRAVGAGLLKPHVATILSLPKPDLEILSRHLSAPRGDDQRWA